MRELYLIWLEKGTDSAELYKVCSSLEIAQKEKNRLKTQINFLKDCYRDRHNSGYDEDVKILSDYDMYADWIYLFQAEFSEMTVQLIDIEKWEVVND